MGIPAERIKYTQFYIRQAHLPEHLPHLADEPRLIGVEQFAQRLDALADVATLVGIAHVNTFGELLHKVARALDIGTTTVVAYLLDGHTGTLLAQSSCQNPQTQFGADVISRIQAALRGMQERQTDAIREGMTALIRNVCADAKIDPAQVGVISVVGNPAMQQLFLGISPENLAKLPFAPVLTELREVAAKDYIPGLENAKLLIVPDISGYIGADTMGCVLSTQIYNKEEVTLMVDIGTNGEMVLFTGTEHGGRLYAASAAAGPALEGAGISTGVGGITGAVSSAADVNGQTENV